MKLGCINLLYMHFAFFFKFKNAVMSSLFYLYSYFVNQIHRLL